MGLILNIETSTNVCSVCLGRNGALIHLEETNVPQAHAGTLTIQIEKLLKATGIVLSDLDAVAISEGPGSYTGLRIGTSVAKGICYALDKPLISVDTLKSIAEATKNKENINGFYIPMIDARRMEVYTAIYGDPSQEPLEITHAKIINESSFQSYINQGLPLILSGNGALKCKPLLGEKNILYSEVECSAANMMGLSQNALNINKICDLAYYSPSYLKSPKITISKKKL